MSTKEALPPDGNEWMTDEVRAALKQIRGQHAAKKRATAIRLAFAKASRISFKAVFGQEDTCSERIWYMKWRFDPAIATAHEICYKRVLEWNDEETGRLESYYRRRRLRSIARYAADAPAALAGIMKDIEIPAGHRINAADRLMQYADPETAQKVGPVGQGGDGQAMNLFLGWGDDELDNVLGNLEAAADYGAPGTAAAPGDRGPGPADVDDRPPEIPET